MEWMPIETHPTDGTHVDLLLEDGEIVADVYWGDCETDDPDDEFGYGWLRNGDYALEEGSVETHWRHTQLAARMFPHGQPN